jgi:glucarate dehydratase
MKITDIRPTTVTVPLEAPLRHANGCHWGRFVRTVIEVDTDEGITGLGEMGGGGESAEAVAAADPEFELGRSAGRAFPFSEGAVTASHLKDVAVARRQ